MQTNQKSMAMQRRALLQLAGTAMAGAGLAGAAGHAMAQTCPPPTSTALVPGEDVAQSALWMAWPSSTSIWGSTLLAKMQTDIALLCRTIAKYEPVMMIANGTTNANTAKTKVGTTTYPVTYISSIPNDDMWMRDSGAVFRRSGTGTLECIKLNFNGWGHKQTVGLDATVADKMATYLRLPLVTASIVGEGGGVIQDGEGTLIANVSSWVNSNRNPGKTQGQIETELLRLYGATKMIWLPGVVGQDITDDHIDATAQFYAPGKIVIHRPRAGATDVWSNDANTDYNLLKTAKDAKGRSFSFTFMDEPVNMRSNSPDMLKSYINYVVVNGAVISVNFGDAVTDAAARANFTAMYPGRTVEMLNLDNLYTGGGGIHCVTQQQPMA